MAIKPAALGSLGTGVKMTLDATRRSAARCKNLGFSSKDEASFGTTPARKILASAVLAAAPLTLLSGSAAAVDPTPHASVIQSASVLGTASQLTSTQQTLVDSALGQLGVSQDCTALVEKALRAAGKEVGDLAPADFFQFGDVVTTPQPGDIAYYEDAGAGVPHVAIVIDEKNAVHGGWTGFTTAVAPIDVGAGPKAYIRVKD